MSKTTREKIIQGYHEWVEERLASSHPEGYFANFMYNHLERSQDSRIYQMQQDVMRFHSILTKHVVRKPDSESWKHLRPIVLGIPDLPVRKRARTASKSNQVNAGLHFNAIVLLGDSHRDTFSLTLNTREISSDAMPSRIH